MLYVIIFECLYACDWMPDRELIQIFMHLLGFCWECKWKLWSLLFVLFFELIADMQQNYIDWTTTTTTTNVNENGSYVHGKCENNNPFIQAILWQTIIIESGNTLQDDPKKE